MTATQYWTPVIVMRGPNCSDARILIVKAEFDDYRDTLTVAIDGHSRTWYRRGAPLYETRQQGIREIQHDHRYPFLLG